MADDDATMKARSKSSGRWLVLAAMAAVVAIVTLDTTILNVAIPTIRSDLHTDLASLQWVIAGYSLMLGSLLIIGGRIGDLFGVRRTFITGAVFFAAGSLLASVATSTPMLVAQRERPVDDRCDFAGLDELGQNEQVRGTL